MKKVLVGMLLAAILVGSPAARCGGASSLDSYLDETSEVLLSMSEWTEWWVGELSEANRFLLQDRFFSILQESGAKYARAVRLNTEKWETISPPRELEVSQLLEEYHNCYEEYLREEWRAAVLLAAAAIGRDLDDIISSLDSIVNNSPEKCVEMSLKALAEMGR